VQRRSYLIIVLFPRLEKWCRPFPKGQGLATNTGSQGLNFHFRQKVNGPQMGATITLKLVLAALFIVRRGAL
jgi:hypothetical protein